MDITAKIDGTTLKGIARIVLFNLHATEEVRKKGLMILEIADNKLISLNVVDHDLHLISKHGDYVELDIEWTLNKDLSVLTRDLFGKGDQKEFSKSKINNLSHNERMKYVIESFDMSNQVIDFHNIHITI